MNIKNFLILVGISAILTGCGGGNKSAPWENKKAVSNPTDIQESYLSSTSLYGTDDGGKSATIAVLLPMTGPSKTIGNNIKTSIETAFLRKSKPNIQMNFYDLSGNRENREMVIDQALSTNPDIIIGPVFAEDTKTLRKKKPSKTPVLSFTSDADALGDGVMTMNLIPTQSIETIIQQMQRDGVKTMIVLAPKDASGKIMASVANKASNLYDLPIKGLFYYESGNSESIKDVALRSSMHNTRVAVNTRAREVLSDILTKEKLSAEHRRSLKKQLETISTTETLGRLPYDAILFLGSGEDSKTLASFLRYYGVGNREAAFYGTTLWQHSDIASDFTMSSAKYATLPEITNNFISLYGMVSGKDPDYLSAFGYDAANMALGMLFTPKSQSAYLYDPSGYYGTNGVFRMQPSGESEHALRIMELNGSGTAATSRPAPENFLTPLYNVRTNNLREIPEKEISSRGINPGDYITLPEYLRKKSEYKTKYIGANYDPDEKEIDNSSEPILIFAPEETERITNPEFEPVKLESVSRKNIDSVEVSE